MSATNATPTITAVSGVTVSGTVVLIKELST
jgi:hypothetical protein